MSNQPQSAQRSNVYLNGVLTAIAVLLGLAVAQGTIGLPEAQEAMAQRVSNASGGSGDAGIINPADQRQMMIAELRRMNEKLDKLNGVLARTPLDVNVVAMPKAAAGGE